MAQLRPTSYLRALKAVRDFENPLSTRTPTVPVTVMVGEHDGVLPAASAQQLAGFLGLPGVTILPDAGHLSNLEQPELFNRALLEHLGSLPQPSF